MKVYFIGAGPGAFDLITIRGAAILSRVPGVISDLLLHYPADTPVALVQRATWPEERVHRGRLGQLLDEIEPRSWLLTTMLLVGDVLSDTKTSESRLYAADYSHRFRKALEKGVAIAIVEEKGMKDVPHT